MSESETNHPSGELQGDAAITSDTEAQLARDHGPALDEQIRFRAYELYRERGGRVGDDMSDWLRAESELRVGVRGTAEASLGGQRAANSAQSGDHG